MKVSIIIPVYNSEEYLLPCLDSVLVQSLQEIEVICIDDASDDGSLGILKQYEQKDKRLKVLSIEKSGQGVARNLGISAASAEFIGFVDGDDRIHPKMFETLYLAATKNNSEIAFCFANAYDSTSGKPISFSYFEMEKEVFGNHPYETTFSRAGILSLLPDITVVPWNKIYKRSFLLQVNARFAETRVHEDIPFFFSSILRATKLTLVREAFYYYKAGRPGSAMSSTATEKDNPVVEILADTEKLISEDLKDPAVSEAFRVFKIRQLIHSLNGIYQNRHISNSDKENFFNKVREEFRNTKSIGIKDIQYRLPFLLIRNDYQFLFKIKVYLNLIQNRFRKVLTNKSIN